MESWRLIWRTGFAKVLPTKGLEALAVALGCDDKRLAQGETTSPPPLMCVRDWPVEAADALGFCGWQGEGLVSVGEVQEFFARKCFECDQILGEPAACRWFLNFWDDTPRPEAFRELAHEVALVLSFRGSTHACAGMRLPEGFVMALQKDTDDSLAFGAIADWLDENGRPDEAAIWRRTGNHILEEKS